MGEGRADGTLCWKVPLRDDAHSPPSLSRSVVFLARGAWTTQSFELASSSASSGPAAAGNGGGGLSWAESRRYLADLEAVLASSSDTGDALAALRSARTELQSIFTASAASAAATLRELQASVARLEGVAADARGPLDAMRAQAAALDGQRAALLESVARMQHERDASGAAVQRLLAATVAYREQLAALAATQAAEVPRRRHWLSLYANITALRWVYDGPGAAAGVLEGYVAPPGGRPARPVRFDPARHATPAALADAMWDAVGAAHGLPPDAGE